MGDPKSGKREKREKKEKQTQVRMGSSLLTRIDEYRARIKREKGLEVAFSTAVRTLIEKGLEVA